MKKIEEILAEFQSWIELELERALGKISVNDIGQARMRKAMEYSLLGGGKRIRAFMIEQSCSFYGIHREKIKPLLVAIEMLHAYSLIHDDLPAMDNSLERRGKPSVHIAFDEATALLTGNALLGLAFDEILKLEFSSDVKLNLMKNLSFAAGYYGMMAGQMFDIMITKMPVISKEENQAMNKMKTGDLFAFCMASGAIIAEKNDEIEKLKEIGYDFGLIFQIADDILDFQADTANKTHEEIEKNFIVQLGGIEEAKKHLILKNQELNLKVIGGYFNLPSMAALVGFIFKRVC